jgi:glycolate oxidase
MLKPEIVDRLKQILGKDSVSVAKEDMVAYSYDATATWRSLPEAVVWPVSTQQISEILRLANENTIPVTSRGGGTNLSGGSIPVKGGILLCTTKMNKILEINKTNLSATVEPGLVLQEFNNELGKQSLFFPPDPQSFLACTLGGMVAENAGGPACAKFGITKQYILGLEVVLASGKVMSLGGITPKNRTGFELMTLFIGSEGTLGVITKITVRLLPLPKSQKSMLAIFDDMVNAGQAVSEVLSSGVIPHKIEFVDDWAIKRFEELTPMGLPLDASALLLIMVSGSKETVETELSQIAETCKRSGAREVRLAKDQAEADKIWKARSSAMSATFSACKTALIEDVAVPRDKIAEFIRRTQAISKKYNVEIPMVGHAADGNIHPNILTDKDDPEHFRRAQKAMDELFKAALEMGGAISGEHGIGLEKRHFFANAIDPTALQISKDIKKLLDPNNILNPGKIWME